MRTVLIPPHAPTLMESTRAIGYTLEAAISDVIDNSLTANATEIDIFFQPFNAYIAILDNGTGIKNIDSAMRYGSQNPNDKRDSNDLGRFGLGMKTASLSQCRTLTVVSKQGENVEARRWDIDFIAQNGDWALIILEMDELGEIPHIYELGALESGTLVVWQNLDRLTVGESDISKALGKKMDITRTHISLVFHRFIEIEGGKVIFRMNGIGITPTDPFIKKYNTQIMSDEFLEINGTEIVVRPYMLPHISKLTTTEIAELGGKEGLRRSQGFYIYRNKRLLVWGTWFRMMQKSEVSKLARIQVDIPNELDDLWTIDIKKSTAIPPEVVRKSLTTIVERLGEQSKRTWVFRGKKETSDSVVHIWNRCRGREGVIYEINREHPLIEIFNIESPEIKRNLKMLLKTIESGIPLNQLYLDLNSEIQIENTLTKEDKEDKEEQEIEKEIELMLQSLLTQAPNEVKKAELLARLAISNPFINYPSIIEKYK